YKLILGPGIFGDMGPLVPSDIELISFTSLRSPPSLVTPRRLVCGKIALISGWCSAKTIVFTLGRIYLSDTESHLRRQTPSPLALLSSAPSRSDAMSAGRSMSINPQKC